MSDPARDRRAELLASLHRSLAEAHREAMTRAATAHDAFLAAVRAAHETLAAGVPGPGVGAGTRAGSQDGNLLEWELTEAGDPWVEDHRAAWTVPVLPLTFELDMLARAAAARRPGSSLPRVVSMEARRWAAFEGGRLSGRIALRDREDGGIEAELRIAPAGRPGETELAAAARFEFGSPDSVVADPGSGALAPIADPKPQDCPYRSGRLFHGPSLQLLHGLVMGRDGSSARVLAESRGVPYGLVHPGLLDACLHAVPFFGIERWFPGPGRGMAAFPYRIRGLQWRRPPPRQGEVQVEARALRVDHGRLPVVRLVLSDGQGTLADFELTLLLVAKGRLAGTAPGAWGRFLSGEGAVAGIALGAGTGSERRLETAAVEELAWIPGTLARVYGLGPDRPDLREELARRDHLGSELRLHPRRIRVGADGSCANLPLNPCRIGTAGDERGVATRLEGPGPLDLSGMAAQWAERGVERGLMVDLVGALLHRFVRRVVLEDPEGHGALAGRSVLYLANHQTGIESLPFCMVTACLRHGPAEALTHRQQMETGILGALYALAQAAFGERLLLGLRVFDTAERESLPAALEGYRGAAAERATSLYVAVEGMRSFHAAHRVERLSSVFLDLAIGSGIPVVPVKFVGGLPRERLDTPLDLPWRLAGQDYYLGEAIGPEELAALAYRDRARLVLDRINGLGPSLEDEEPSPPDPEFLARVAELERSGTRGLAAVVVAALSGLEDPCPETRDFLGALAEGTPVAALESPLVAGILALATGGDRGR